jgi:branched-chain amino acid transport system permease protein
MLLALLAVPPWLGNYEHFILCSILVHLLVVLGLVILIGFAGQISIGHAGFWALGAFGSGVLITAFNMPFLVGLAFGAVVAAGFGALVAIPALRVQGHYLAIATLGFALITQQVLFEWESVTGGRKGLFVPRPSVLGFEFSSDLALYYLFLAIALPLFWLAWRLPRTRFGTRLLSLKLSPIASVSFGVPRARYLVAAFTLSAAYAGVSGAMFAAMIGHISTETFSLGASLGFLTAAVIGGVTAPLGAVLGSVYLTTAPEIFREFKDAQMVVYGVMLVLFIRFLPGGLVSLPKVILSKLRSGKQGERAH